MTTTAERYEFTASEQLEGYESTIKFNRDTDSSKIASSWTYFAVIKEGRWQVDITFTRGRRGSRRMEVRPKFNGKVKGNHYLKPGETTHAHFDIEGYGQLELGVDGRGRIDAVVRLVRIDIPEPKKVTNTVTVNSPAISINDWKRELGLYTSAIPNKAVKAPTKMDIDPATQMPRIPWPKHHWQTKPEGSLLKVHLICDDPDWVLEYGFSMAIELNGATHEKVQRAAQDVLDELNKHGRATHTPKRTLQHETVDYHPRKGIVG